MSFKVSGFTIMDDIDLRYLDTKSLHAMFQRDPFKILGRLAKEGGYDLWKALKKWDMEEHGHLTYSIYVIDFPSAVKVHLHEIFILSNCMTISFIRMLVLFWIKLFILSSGIISKRSKRKAPLAICTSLSIVPSHSHSFLFLSVNLSIH